MLVGCFGGGEGAHLEEVVECRFGFAAEVGGVRGETPLGGPDGLCDGGGEGAEGAGEGGFQSVGVGGLEGGNCI